MGELSSPTLKLVYHFSTSINYFNFFQALYILLAERQGSALKLLIYCFGLLHRISFKSSYFIFCFNNIHERRIIEKLRKIHQQTKKKNGQSMVWKENSSVIVMLCNFLNDLFSAVK
jgi:hypothetical protein